VLLLLETGDWICIVTERVCRLSCITIVRDR